MDSGIMITIKTCVLLVTYSSALVARSTAWPRVVVRSVTDALLGGGVTGVRDMNVTL